jgi:hypothetical protein
MKAIVVSNGQIIVDGTVYNSLTYKAKLDGSGLIAIYNDPVGLDAVGHDFIVSGAAAGDVSLNGTTYSSVTEFIVAFNALVINPLFKANN